MFCSAISVGNGEEERSYIFQEAKTLFRKNRSLQDVKKIEEKIFEAESRLELGIHYGIPYPRPSNVSPLATGKTRETPKPAYMNSYDELDNKIASMKKLPSYGNDDHLDRVLPPEKKTNKNHH